MNRLKPGQSHDSIARLQDIQDMNAKQLLAKFKIVVYSKEDVKNINRGLTIINKVLEKNRERRG